MDLDPAAAAARAPAAAGNAPVRGSAAGGRTDTDGSTPGAAPAVAPPAGAGPGGGAGMDGGGADGGAGSGGAPGDGAPRGAGGDGRWRDRVTGTRADYLRAAVTPRMLGLFVLLLAAALVCVRLGAWQLDRATSRGAEAAETAHAARLARDPVPLEDVLRAQTSFTADELAVPVEVTGAYRPGQQVLVPDRAVDGEDAALVVTGLWVSRGRDAGAMIPVVRGWVPSASISTEGGAAEPADAATAALLAVPTGEQTVTGYLGGSEAAVSERYPSGMVGAISSAELANLWGGPTYGGYLVAFTEAPDGTRSATSPTGLPHAPPPTMAEETGLNIQNLAYAAEWVIFGGFALFVWWRMVRDDVAYRREDVGVA
ncbi:SURF1 family protein [Georgenia sp. SYP-B2076]|uniref:SURF1 family protein n=1 Tax=Georgenia sp. SYP-B2076 TaxID=2495881 RepID=UPI001F0C815F|nr:SURF1 family protein [Georgenia sp. SYP-B2076]